jgi:hypothetical protein
LKKFSQQLNKYLQVIIKIIKKGMCLININLGGNMDFKSFLIGFVLAVAVFLLVGAGGGNESSRYQIRDESSPSATIIDTQTGIAKKIHKGRVVETFNFNAQ